MPGGIAHARCSSNPTDLSVSFCAAFPVRFLAQVPTDHVLTNADIVKMTNAGISESNIVREIQMSRSDFSTSPAALIELKRHGVSESVLGAVLDSRLGGGMSASGTQQILYIPAHSATPGLHHLPSFEADLKLNSKTTGKLSVGRNQIKLEQAGVPVFSLKWKEPHGAK